MKVGKISDTWILKVHSNLIMIVILLIGEIDTNFITKIHKWSITSNDKRAFIVWFSTQKPSGWVVQHIPQLYSLGKD